MLAVLLESRARQQRRAGGAALSVATHLAIIGAVAAATARGTTVKRAADKPVWVNIVPPHVGAPPPLAREVAHGFPRIPRPDDIAIPRVDVDIAKPTLAIDVNPTVGDLSAASTLTCIACRGGMRGLIGEPDGEGGGDGASAEWRGSELLMRIETQGALRYPAQLRDAGIDGSVLVQFTVDTTGRVDMSSLKVLASTHTLFTVAVRDALSRFRFRPAEVGGRRVPALAQMPFEFRLQK